MIAPCFSRNDLTQIKRSRSENAVRDQKALNTHQSQNHLLTTCNQNHLLENGGCYGQSNNEMLDHRNIQNSRLDINIAENDQLNMPSINYLTDQEIRSQQQPNHHHHSKDQSSHSNGQLTTGFKNQIQISTDDHTDYKSKYLVAMKLVNKQQAQLTLLFQKLRHQQDVNDQNLNQSDICQQQSLIIQQIQMEKAEMQLLLDRTLLQLEQKKT